MKRIDEFDEFNDLSIVQQRHILSLEDVIRRLRAEVKSLQEENEALCETCRNLEAENRSILDCLDGSSTAKYTADMYDKVLEENKRLAAESAEKTENYRQMTEWNQRLVRENNELKMKIAGLKGQVQGYQDALRDKELKE
jgi:predicted  nucleic acid-binding Zn-ribbon protein